MPIRGRVVVVAVVVVAATATSAALAVRESSDVSDRLPTLQSHAAANRLIARLDAGDSVYVGGAVFTPSPSTRPKVSEGVAARIAARDCHSPPDDCHGLAVRLVTYTDQQPPPAWEPGLAWVAVIPSAPVQSLGPTPLPADLREPVILLMSAATGRVRSVTQTSEFTVVKGPA